MGLGFFAAVHIAGSAHAKDWFDFDREEALKRVRAAVDRLEAIAPIPPLRCRPRPTVIRSCFSEVVAGLEIDFSTVLGMDQSRATAADHGRFMESENIGKTYEIEVRLAGERDRNPNAPAMFDALCAALILAVRPSLGVAGATRRYQTQMRRSINKAATGDGEVKLIGNPETLIIDSWRDGAATCKVSAEDDYRPP